jgi:DNA-binding transcriptional regulator YdaS (Cro superfamily)
MRHKISNKGILRDYLYLNDLTIKELAEKINYAPHHLSSYMVGRHRMGMKCALMIEKFTKGKLTAEQLMKENVKIVPESRKRSIAKKH